MSNTRNYPKWQKVSSTIIWDKRMHIIEDDVILPGGEKSTYIYEHGRGAAATLILYKGKVLLSRQYRYPLDRWIYDLPGGGIDEEETAEHAAIRECIEELGMEPKKVLPLRTFHPNPARTDWATHLFFCDTIKTASLKKRITQEASEVVHKALLSVDELEKLIHKGEIVDPGLLIAWYSAKDRGLL